MRRASSEIALTSYEDIFGLEEDCAEKVVNMKLSQMHGFKNHPFKVLNDDKMIETVESIKKYGVLMPGLVRPCADGDYEIVAGHRRHMASELAGNTTMPVIIRNLSDDEATIIMVDSNIQRENILPSEKAFAYKMKMEAMKHQGAKGGMKITADLVGEESGDCGRQVQRYIRLTALLPGLLELVDSDKIKFTPAVDISSLIKEEQQWLLECIQNNGVYPSGSMASKLKQYSTNGELTSAMVGLIMLEEKQAPVKVTLSADKIKTYFPTEYSKQQIETIIYELLEGWKQAQ